MSVINISLDTLKEIVEKANDELGGTNGTVVIREYEGMTGGCWGSKEHKHTPKISHHELGIDKDQYYELKFTFGQLVSKKP